MTMAMLRRGQLIPVPPVDEGAALPRVRGRARRADPAARIVGAPEPVRAGLETLAAEYGADEVMVVTITHDHAARRRCYELIAEAFGLGALRPAA